MIRWGELRGILAGHREDSVHREDEAGSSAASARHKGKNSHASYSVSDRMDV